jgi:PAS domain S-box-containing protein/diguanylate cyclase (GGDEF)-like protein
MFKSIFALAFKPVVALTGKISFLKKIVLILTFFLLPLGLTTAFIYLDFDKRFDTINKNKKDVQKNYALYKMILLVQDYELSADLYIEEASDASKRQLKKSETRLLDATENLLSCLDKEIRGYCDNYYDQAYLALLSQDSEKFLQYTREYKYFLYKRIVSVELTGRLQEEDALATTAYLLSVELPYSTVLISDVHAMQDRDRLLMKLGKVKGSVEKTDLLLQSFENYNNHFENENINYKSSVEKFIAYRLEGDQRRSLEMQDTVLSLQLSIFNALQSLLDKHLSAQMQNLQLKQYLFICVAILCALLALYLFIGAYISLTHSLRAFFATTVEVSKGNLHERVAIKTDDEMGELADEYNKMIESLDYNFSLLNEYKRAVDSSGIVLKTDVNGIITYVNSAYESISGYSKKELIGSTHRLVRSKSTTGEKIEEVWEFLKNKKTYKTVFENISKNGKSFFVESTIVPILNRSGEISEFISIMFDITPLYRQKEKLQSQLYKDELTSLPNRLKLIQDITQTEKTKLVVINIDGFKEINSIYGENIGDLTLQKMAKEIKNALNTRHLQLYKLSADEFAILAGKDISIEYFKEDVAMLSHYLSHIKLECAEHIISVRLTLGAAISELHHSQRPLISMADMALKEAKRRMKPYLFYYNLPNVDEDLEKNYQMVQIIEQAIKEAKVGCSYQGIINAKTGKIEKYETLMRLEDDKGKRISPQAFVGIAKRARYYPLLTQKVVQEALFTFMNRSESVSINLSIDDMMDDDTYRFILDALRNCGCADRVVFELLETEEIDFNERVVEFTNQVKKLGVQIAIDDFGSGYSNYAYLMKLGVDILKIDASLIKEVDHDENSRLIVASIIDIAHSLGMKTVAEHVHNKEIESIVKEMGVDYLQGYYLHKPMDLEANL